MEKAREAMLEQFENQHSRGTRGFGLVEVNTKNVRVRRATEGTLALLNVVRSEAPILLFHHRIPTSTDNTLQTAHPIKVSHSELNGDWYIMHNGVVGNCDELKKAHEALGYVYTTQVKEQYHYQNSSWEKFNDSEALAIELVRYMEGKTEEVSWRGSAAFIGVKVNKKTGKPSLIIYGRGDTNPLQMKETEDNLIIASEIPGENVFDHDLKTVSILSLKAIREKDLWPKDSKENTPLLDMAYGSELKIKEPPPVPVVRTTYRGEHTHYNNFTEKDKVRPLGLLEAGRNEKEDGEASNAVIHYGPTEEDSPTEKTIETPKQRAFSKMADKVTEKIAVIIADIFENLSEGEVDEQDMFGYMKDIEKVITDRFQGAERARFHLDKQEEAQMAIDLDTQRALPGLLVCKVNEDQLERSLSNINP